jgi:hypothetical protein
MPVRSTLQTIKKAATLEVAALITGRAFHFAIL